VQGVKARGDETRLTGVGLDILERGGIFVALVLVIIVAAILSPAFFNSGNVFNVLRAAVPLGIVAIGQTIVMLAGGIDLSLAGVMAMTTVVVADISKGDDSRLLPALLVVFAIGTAVGLLNGLLVTRRGVPPFIATLGVAILMEGVRFVYTRAAPSGSIPDAARFFGNAAIGPVPTNLIVFIVLAAVCLFVLHKTEFGRHVYAVGVNREAARLSGVAVDRVRVLTYVICSNLAVLGGLILAGFIGYADNFLGQGYELDSIAAVVIGGTSFAGGVGGIGGTIVGVLLLTMLFNIVLLLSLPVEYQLVVKGLVIIVAVALYSFRARR
jgi:ribose/xylose/arabinose/galactoside ABC-type transport system permease subunit